MTGSAFQAIDVVFCGGSLLEGEFEGERGLRLHSVFLFFPVGGFMFVLFFYQVASGCLEMPQETPKLVSIFPKMPL